MGSPTLNDKFLYHFTTARSLIRILENMTLKMSSFENLNDLNEKEVNFIFPDWWNGLKIEKFIVEHCQLISFSQNFQIEDSHWECGCNHPRMWAQYADNNKGACIVINENKLIELNKHILDNIFWKIEDVIYKPYMYNGNFEESIEPCIFIENYYKKIFFEKHNDWKQENERRLFCIGGPEFLSINGCIEFICLGNKFDDNNYTLLTDIIIANLEKDFIRLRPHDFKFQKNTEGRCSAEDNAFRIIKHMKKKANIANKCLAYLNNNGY